MEEKKVPALRFRGFDNAWEQRCLGECFEERNENMPKGELISVTINDGVKRFSELGRHDNSNENKSKYKKVCVGDIPYNSMRMWQGASGYSMYEGIVSPAYTVLKPKEGVNSRCVSYLFKREDMIHTFQLNSQGITSDNWNLKYPKLSQIGIFLPLNLREQEKIVECFVKLDHLISLHQRKLEMLKKVKKSMLEKMFPKNDAKVPEVRFSDFTDAWEQRCLGECFEERNENMPKGELISVTINDGVKRFSELGRHDNSNENKSKYKKVCVGDIPYNSMRMWQGASGYSMYEGIVSPAYTVLKPKEGVNSRCVSYLFKREDMIHTFQLNSQGITSDNWNLKYPKLSQIGIFLPLNLREQEKIVECFVKLDHLISLHQRKLEKLKNIKKSMLEKMFII